MNNDNLIEKIDNEQQEYKKDEIIYNLQKDLLCFYLKNEEKIEIINNYEKETEYLKNKLIKLNYIYDCNNCLEYNLHENEIKNCKMCSTLGCINCFFKYLDNDFYCYDCKIKFKNY